MASKQSNSLAKNSILNGIKQCCVIVFPLIIFPYVSRVLGAENYGKVSFANSIVEYIGMLAALGITNYAIREGSKVRNDKNTLNRTANEIFTLNVLSTVVAYVCLAILMVCSSKLKPYSSLIIVLSINVAATTLGTDWLNSVYEDYYYLTIRYIVCHIISLALIFLLVKNESDFLLYAALNMSALTMANIFNIFHVRSKLGIKIRFQITPGIIRHIKPVLIIFGTAVATTIYINSDITILGILKNDTVVGHYTVAAKIYRLIKQLFNAFLIVGLPRFSNYIAEGKTENLKKQLHAILSVLLIIIIPASVGLCMLSENVVLLLSGKDYLPAGTPLSFLAISLVFATLACFYVNIIMLPKGLEKIIFLATIISAIVNIVLNFVLIPFWGASAAAITTLISEIIMFCFGIFYTRDLKLKPIKPLSISIGGAALTFLICYASKKFISNYLICLFAAIGTSVISYGLIVALLYRKNIQLFISNRKK